MKGFLFLILLVFIETNKGHCQYNWKPQKDKNGIKVYLSDVAGSSFKAIKVECTLTGSYAKLIALLTNVSGLKNWIYHNKTSYLLKQNSPLDFVYYSETSMPWPLSNRDVILHLKINTDSLPKFLSIKGYNEPHFFPEIPGIVRVPHYKANWTVTMPTAQSLHISYILEIDPGGSIPAWLANSFADKGPFGTFSNLADLLKK
ncbi:MAG: hypothetical protein HZB42_10960 [Sphingobacteriales bacterium]|nr:hypothetical protein [Sphingobacteriales bacterium]